uniref:Glutamate-1-semialdehyde aminotransferase n=1 Tax=Cenarchaeum symbiosum TaxID=46770 RepID=O74061_CENSM|nr:glutamate-1-semialdehyde aminotransferase [Cenarchaeum symbiosum]
MDLEREYRAKTRGSAGIFARSRRYHVGGVSHNIRYYEPYPFVTRSARGKHLVDVDGNKYTDYWMGHWSLILGHAPAQVRSAVEGQLRRGWIHGTANEPTMRLSEIIRGAVKAAEKIRYVTSGTEAVMYAARMARARTGKKVIAKVDGGWHGYASGLLKSVNWPYDVPESGGLVDEEHTVSIPYNNLEGSLEALRRAGGDLACVIVEPMLGGGGCIPAEPDYLRGIQEFVHSKGALFILDEIVTGFRFDFGCAYKKMGLDPDVVALGKIVGGGFPIGVVCGKDEVMCISDTGAHARTERAYIGGGTFSANPATMTAGAAALGALRERRGTLYPRINSMGDDARARLSRIFDGRVAVTGRGSLFMTHFTPDGARRISSAADAAACDVHLLHRYHLDMITRDGIFFLPGKLGAISAAHSRADLGAMYSASERFAGGL